MWKQIRAILYWIRLLIGSQWRSKGSDVGRFRSFKDEASWKVDHTLNFIKENLRASKDSITIIRPSAYREQERKREFLWLQEKDSVGWNRSAWSPSKQADRVCSPVPSMQAGWQKKGHQGYELHWKMGCHSDPHIVTKVKGDQFQELSLSEECPFFVAI